MGSVCPHMGCPDYHCYEAEMYKLLVQKGDKRVAPTTWFNNDGSGVAVSTKEPGLVLLGDYIPDWIMVPPGSPQRAGEKLRVLGHANGQCPMCRKHIVRILALEDDFRCAECVPGGCGFVLYRLLSVNTKPEGSVAYRASIDVKEMDESDRRYGERYDDDADEE